MTLQKKNRPSFAVVHPGWDLGWIDRSVRHQNRRVFHRGGVELDLYVVRTQRRLVTGRDRHPVRANLDARAGFPQAEQVTHRFQRGAIQMSVEAAIKPVPAGASSPSPGPATVIRKAAVLGAGTMGSRIAAHLANAGLPVVLLDI